MSGALSDGQIVIEAAKTDKVHLVLNGVDITSKTSAPIHASQCDKLIITLADGTENSLTDAGSSFQYVDPVEKEPNAALFCKDDLTINGTGALTVNAGFKNGIVSKDDLLIVSGDITVTAANHGLRGNDSRRSSAETWISQRATMASKPTIPKTARWGGSSLKTAPLRSQPDMMASRPTLRST